MEERIQIDDEVMVGAQPSASDIETLAEKGFRSVANLRTDGEDEQPLSPGEERDEVEKAGLRYLHFPVETSKLREDHVDSFREEFARLPRPAYVHCRSGKRAGAFVVMDKAVQAGQSGKDAIRKAEKMGFDPDEPELMSFVESYIDQRSR